MLSDFPSLDSKMFVTVYLLTLLSAVLADGRPTATSSGAQTGNSSQSSPMNAAAPQVIYDNMTYNRLEMFRIAAIKRDILSKLGMVQEPDVSRVNTSVQEKRQILRLYKKSLEELHGKTYTLFDDDVFYASQFHSFTDNGDRPINVEMNELLRSRDKLRVYFNIDITEPMEPDQETIVTSATLKLYKSAVHCDQLIATDTVDRTIRVDVFQVVDVQVTVDNVKTDRRYVDSKLVSLTDVGWEKFDVSRAVQDWIRDSTTNLGLEVAFTDSRYRLSDVIEFESSQYMESNDVTLLGVHWPSLNVLTQQRPIISRRHKRQTTSHVTERQDCVAGDGETRCCRYPVTISFRDIGWSDWIVTPESYQSYYCYGNCPIGYRIAHRFASIKSIMLDINRSSSFSLSCTATRMGHLSLAHYDHEGRLKVSVFENMWPEECMCA